MARRGQLCAAHFNTPEGTVRRTYHAQHMAQANAIAKSIAQRNGWQVKWVGSATMQHSTEAAPIQYKGGGIYAPPE